MPVTPAQRRRSWSEQLAAGIVHNVYYLVFHVFSSSCRFFILYRHNIIELIEICRPNHRVP